MLPKTKPFAEWTPEEIRAFDERQAELDAEMAVSEERAEREGRPLNEIVLEDTARKYGGMSDEQIQKCLAQWKTSVAAVQAALE